MPSYKLIYFDSRGRAEGCRLLFALAGVDYEDVRVDQEEWKTLKPQTKFGQLPVLEIDGKQFAESEALIRYLAREFGLYGKDNLEALAIDEVLAIIADFIQAVIKVYTAPEDKKEEIGKDFKENHSPKFLGWLEKLLKESGSGYFVGNSATVADVMCFAFVSAVEKLFPGSMDAFPLVKALVDRVGNLDNIKAWVAKRPDTQS